MRMQKLRSLQTELMSVFYTHPDKQFTRLELMSVKTTPVTKQAIYQCLDSLIERGLIDKIIINQRAVRYRLAAGATLVNSKQPRCRLHLCANCNLATTGRYARWGDLRLCKHCNKSLTFLPDGTIATWSEYHHHYKAKS